MQLLENRLVSAQNMQLNRKNQQYIALTSKLDAMSPLKVLTRGYAMVQNQDRQLVRSIADVDLAQTVHVSLTDGNFTAIVTDRKERSL